MSKPIYVHRLPKDKLKELAKRELRGEVLITNNEDAMKHAFYVVLPFIRFRKGEVEKVGALVGFMDEVIPGRAMNGYPIFTSVQFIHKADLDYLVDVQEKLREAMEAV